MRKENPSPYTPEGQIELARRFGTGWRTAARWKKRGLLLVPLIPLSLTAVAFIIYLVIKAIPNLF